VRHDGVLLLVDGREDVRLVGALGHVLLLGRARLSGMPWPSQVRADIPPALAEVLQRAMAENLEDRFQTIAELKGALQATLGAHDSRVPAAPPRAKAPALPDIQVEVHGEGWEAPGHLRCLQLLRGGLFACTDAPLPPLFSGLQLVLHVPGGELACAGEVVRHVSASEAEVWGMPAGFAVQFAELSGDLQEGLSRVLQGLPLLPPRPAPVVEDDAEAEETLEEVLGRNVEDPYEVLSVWPDAAVSEVHRLAREQHRALDAVGERPLSPAQREKLKTCHERLAEAASVLGNPARRAEHDAFTGNFRGVARCLTAGLGLTELEACRDRFLAAHRTAAERARIHEYAAQAFSRRGDIHRALRQYELALALDPLNLELHHPYWALKRVEAQGMSGGRMVAQSG